jgi:hypothetical protein
MTNSARMVISLGLGVLVGLLMAFVLPYHAAGHWLFTHEGITLAYRVVHHPAIVITVCWGRLGLPFPSGVWGAYSYLSYAILIQWVLLGALGGWAWQRVSRHKARQKDA